MNKKKLILYIVLWACCLVWSAFAHQPRIPDGNPTLVADPEISKAYYGTLQWSPQTYRVSSDKNFSLYVNILVPDIANQKKDLSVTIIKDNDSGNPLAVLDGNTFARKQFFEPFGHDTYRQWPEYKMQAAPWTYDIIVSSSTNDSKYSLAIGGKEVFDIAETINALTLIPKLKVSFFDTSPADFIRSPFWFGLIIIMFAWWFIVGFLYRFILKKISSPSVQPRAHRNIGTTDRLLRLGIGIALLIRAITTSRSPWLLFFSGFSFFEAIFSWCWFYAAIGKNTCPLE